MFKVIHIVFCIGFLKESMYGCEGGTGVEWITVMTGCQGDGAGGSLIHNLCYSGVWNYRWQLHPPVVAQR